MNIHKAEALALELMDLHRLFDMGYFFEFNNHKNSAGICNYTHKTIELSKPLTELANEEDVKDTILHEIAHALVGSGHGHDAVWQRKAIQIGCNGKQCYGGDNKKSLTIAYNMIAKYKGTCAGGHNHYRNRLTKKKYSCSECYPKYNEKYLITWKLV